MSRQARSLDTLLAEVNKHAPKRNKASDGGLGDPAHAARVSDHNPNRAGVWRARDFTSDAAHGLPGDYLAEHLAMKLGKHPAAGSGAYVIWERRIISTDRRSEGWRPYKGDNPHTKHVHLSVATTASGYDNTTPWNLWEKTPKKAGWSMYHVAKGVPYFVGNSPQAVRRAAAAGKDYIDLDAKITKDGVIVNTHWGQPLLHGFRDPLKKIKRTAKVRDLTWSEVSRLVATHKGETYKIKRMVEQIATARSLKIGVEMETKLDSRFERASTYDEIAAMRRQGALVVVKVVGNVIVKARGRYLKAAKTAGLPTLYSPHGQWLLKANAKFATYFRGTTWRTR